MWIFHILQSFCRVITEAMSELFSYVTTAKKLPKNEPQGVAGSGGRARGGVDLQEAAPQGRSGGCCGGGN